MEIITYTNFKLNLVTLFDVANKFYQHLTKWYTEYWMLQFKIK